MRKYILFLIIVFCALWVLGSASAQAATINAASCSQTDIQAAVDASMDGDIVSILPCSATSFITPVTINNKAITIQGAGIGNTNLRMSANNGKLLYVPSINTKAVTITGISFSKAAGLTCNIDCSSIWIGGGNNFRIHHNNFDDSLLGIGSAGIYITNGTYGLIDNNLFTNVYASIFVYGPGDTTWAADTNLGDEKSVYIEDNTFLVEYPYYTGAAVESGYGGSYVFRYNNVTGTGTGQHGACESGGRGHRRTEVYHNIFNVQPNVNTWCASAFAGGTGVNFNNRYIGGYANPLLFFHKRTCHQNECASPYNVRCDGTQSIDGNEDSTGYPCRDQEGLGKNQAKEPIYIWNNCSQAYSCSDDVLCSCGGEGYIVDLEGWPGWVCSNPSLSDHVKANRDYFNRTIKSGYSPLTYPHPLRGGVQPQTCGNNIREGTETCDGTDLAGQTCVSRGFSGGTLACSFQCSGFVTTGCTSSQHFLPEQIVQAESGTLAGILTGTSGSDTYIYTNLDNTGSASFAFDIQNAGQYKMEARVNNNNNGGLNSFFVGLDSEAAQGNVYYAYHLFPLQIGFFWDNVSRWGNGQTGNPPISEFDPMTWNLIQGSHTFTFYGREANTWLDQIILKRVTTDITPPAAPTGVTVK